MMYGISSERRCKSFDCKRIGTVSCYKRIGVFDCSSCYQEGRCSSCKNAVETQARPYSQYRCTLNDATGGAVGGACRRDNIASNE